MYSESQSYITADGLSGTDLGTVINFPLSPFNYFLDSCGFVDVGRPI
jgi:hypothetical protein